MDDPRHRPQDSQSYQGCSKKRGISVGTWVRRGMVRALDTTRDGPVTVIELSERMRVLEARLTVLEKSHLSLHKRVDVAELTATSKGKKQAR